MVLALAGILVGAAAGLAFGRYRWLRPLRHEWKVLVNRQNYLAARCAVLERRVVSDEAMVELQRENAELRRRVDF